MFGEEFVGEGSIGEIEQGLMSEGQPTDLHSYQNIGDTVIHYWTYDPFAYAIYSFKWELQTDLVGTFDSPDLLSYASDTIAPESYITGCIHRGMSVPIYPRLEGESRRMYWRVRAVYESESGAWASSYFDIPQATRVAVRTSLLSFLPDTLYDKTPGYTPGDGGSNIFKIHDNTAKEFDNCNQQLNFVNNDLYIKSARDTALQPNFGDLIGISKPDYMKTIDYREILKTFMVNIRTAPNTAAIRNMVYGVYRNEPVFHRISDVYGEYVYGSGLQDAYVYGDGLEDKYVWDNEHLATGMIIEVLNQLACGADVTKEYVEGLVHNMVLAHTPVYLKPVI